MATITCSQQVKDAKTGEMRNCKVAPVKGSEKCKRHGGDVAVTTTNAANAAPAPAAQTKTVAATAASATKTTGGVAICKATVKSTNKPCGNKATKGDFCGRHGPKDAKAPPVSTDGSGYPTNCKKTTGKNVACKNNAYGPDSAGVPSCSRHGGPKKEGTTASAGSGASSGGATYSGPLAGVPVIHIMSVVGKYLIAQTAPEAVEANNEGFEAQYEVANWLVQWFNLFDGKTPNDDEIVEKLRDLTSTADGENFMEHYATDEGESSMLLHMADMIGRENVNWLIEYIRKYASMNLVGSEEVAELFEVIREEFELPEVKAPEPKPATQNVGNEQKSTSGRKQFNDIMDKVRSKAFGDVPKEEPKKEEVPEAAAENVAAQDDEIMA